MKSGRKRPKKHVSNPILTPGHSPNDLRKKDFFDFFRPRLGFFSKKSQILADLGRFSDFYISNHNQIPQGYFQTYMPSLGRSGSICTLKNVKNSLFGKNVLFFQVLFLLLLLLFGYHGVVFQKVQAQGFQKSIWSLGLSLTNKKLISFLFLKHHCYSPLF